MRHRCIAMGVALVSWVAVATAAWAAKDAGSPGLPPLPGNAHVGQVIHLDGKALHYTVTVGSLPVRDAKGRVTGQVVFTAYTVPGARRPVTFGINGGPGASSVFLNFGAIGPRHLEFGNQGDSASAPVRLEDNPGTWLGFTDLVFIDPVGTGYSRALVPAAEAKKDFYSTDADIHYLSRIIYDWLVQNRRLRSPKYFVGESYGGFRGPRIVRYLQTTLGVGMNGMVLLSPYLNPTIGDNPEVSPMPWIIDLPSIVAAHLEREHRLTPQAMAKVVDYAEGDYATALMKGRSDPAATAAMISHVTRITGLDPAFVARSGGRIDPGAYVREAFREEGRVGSWYDPNVTEWDPYPDAPDQRGGDAVDDSAMAPLTTAMADFVTRVVGWKTDARYYTFDNAITMDKAWGFDASLRKGATQQLREAVAADDGLRVLIAHGWNDLVCPFMGSLLTVDQMSAMGDPSRVQVKEYPGGHMFYTRLPSREAFARDVRAMYTHR